MNSKSRVCPLCHTSERWIKKFYKNDYRICMECGFVHQNPIKDGSYYNKLPYESQYNDYDNHTENRALYIHDFICNSVSGFNPENILDVGCGYGGVLYNLGLYYPHAELTGITDRNSDFEFAKKRYNLNVLVGDAESGFFTKVGKKYDLIIMSHFLEHIIDPTKLMININKILSDRGIIYIEVPSLYYAGIRSKDVFVPQHLSYFNKNTLKYLLNSSLA